MALRPIKYEFGVENQRGLRDASIPFGDTHNNIYSLLITGILQNVRQHLDLTNGRCSVGHGGSTLDVDNIRIHIPLNLSLSAYYRGIIPWCVKRFRIGFFIITIRRGCAGLP